jgi:ribonuclease HII
MSPAKREEIFEKIKDARSVKKVEFVVIMESAKIIDAKGISWAIKKAIKKCLKKLGVHPDQTLVLLDGGIKAPVEFIHQKTIIRGDDKELVISLASICAKVTRDAHMRKMAKKYPQYGLEVHKGYGTLRHRTAIRKHGTSPIHRKSFLKNIDFVK